jgi:hypothetical protein
MKLCTVVQEGCGYKDNTARASLLCSVGKIFHCVHYLSAGLRNYFDEECQIEIEDNNESLQEND